MTTTNQQLARADIAIADLNTNGGLLNPQQANTFIDMVMEQRTILPQVRVVRMNAPEVKINRIGFGERILRAARQAGGELDAGGNDRYVRAADRAKPSTTQIVLRDSEVIAEVRLPYEVLEDNLEGAALEAHIMRLIAERAALDLEEWALWADTALAGTDAFIGLQDGWLKRASAHIYGNSSAGIDPDVFTNALLALPQKYLQRLPQLKAFISMANTLRYRQNVSRRMTGAGDSALFGAGPLNANGLALEGAPALAADGVGDKGLITFPQNLLFGIRRDITVETDKDIRSREYIIVLTMRAALQIDDVDAVVKLEEI